MKIHRTKIFGYSVKKQISVGSLVFSSTTQEVFVGGGIFDKALFLLHLET